MRLLIDTHTHTAYSGHATGTYAEHAANAAKAGLEGFVVTDHGPAVVRVDDLSWLDEFCALPPVIGGIRIYRGAEANIIDHKGTLDLPREWTESLEFLLASFHSGCIAKGSSADYTDSMIAALKDPILDVLAHPGNPEFPVDIETVVRTAAEYGKLIEINNSSFRTRKGSEQNCLTFLRMCKKHGVRVVTASDCHVSADIGRFEVIRLMFAETEFPSELVLTRSGKTFDEYLAERRKRLLA